MSRKKYSLFDFWVIFLIVFFLNSPWILGQAGRGKARLKGVVLDENGQPVPSAQVVLELLSSEQVKREVKTNKKGEWAILGLGSGNWRVTASAEGFIPTTTTIFVSQIEKNPKVVLKLKKIKVSQKGLRDEASLDYLEKAASLYTNKKYDEALAILEEAITEYPETYQVRILMGDCYREKAELDRALELYTQAVQEIPDDEMGKEIKAKTFSAIGDCYLRKGDLEKAQTFFKQSIETYPENEIIPYNVGEIYFANQKLDEAIQYFSLATKIKPDWALSLIHI